MEFMLLFTMERNAPKHGERMARMTAFSGELADAGKLLRGAPLASDAEAVCVRVRGGEAIVSDGPFAESKEVLGGFWLVDVADRAAAIEIAKRTPHAEWGTVEVHRLAGRYPAADTEKGIPYLLAFRMEPGLVPSPDKLSKMIEFGESLVRAGKQFETAPLADDPPPARVTVRGGEPLVVDGPFAEAKELVGGYSLIRAEDADEALAIAKRYPHATWGPVEVRRVLFFDRVSR